MLKDYMGIINLDEDEGKIKELTKKRVLGCLPIGGRYKIIDFVLSNMTNSGIYNVGIFTKKNSRSLMEHLNDGSPWDLNRKIEGIRFFNFNESGKNVEDIYNFANNMEYLYKSKQEYVMISSSHMICNIDLEKVMDFHKNSQNDITIVYKNVKDAKDSFLGCEVLNIDKNGRVISVEKNLGNKKEVNICMEMYFMKKQFFIDSVNKCITFGSPKKFKKNIYDSPQEYSVGSYEFKGYLSCINSLKSYYNANMDLLDKKVNRELFSLKRPIYTKTNDESPTRYVNGSSVKKSIIGNGSLIEGTVENSIIFRNVIVRKGAEIRNSIIFRDCVIGEDAKLSYVISDKFIKINENRELKGECETPLIVGKNNKSIVLIA